MGFADGLDVAYKKESVMKNPKILSLCRWLNGAPNMEPDEQAWNRLGDGKHHLVINSLLACFLHTVVDSSFRTTALSSFSFCPQYLAQCFTQTWHSFIFLMFNEWMNDLETKHSFFSLNSYNYIPLEERISFNHHWIPASKTKPVQNVAE